MSSRFHAFSHAAAASSHRSAAVLPVETAIDDDQTARLSLRMRLHQQLLDHINLSAIDKMPPEELRRQVAEIVREMLSREQTAMNVKEQAQLTADILDELLGLGPLEPLLKDPAISEILVNTHAQVIVERAGKLEQTSVRFKDDRHLLRIINKIVGNVGRRVDESQPLVDARLADGSRVNAVIPPVAVDGPLLSIRKFSRNPYSLTRMIEAGSLSAPMAVFLDLVVKGKLNVLISGGTGSGKTTMLNAMSLSIGQDERIITIEDAAELQLQQTQVARMETRPSNVEGKGEITQRDLVRNALRMRPDRIILGEVRSGEAFDMLQAMNTGHGGSMSTVHANTCRDALSRLEQMIGMAGIEMSQRTVRTQIASAIQIVLQLERMNDGRRRLTSIHEVSGMEGDMITMTEIFHFDRRGTDAEGKVLGSFTATGLRPRCMREMEAKGIHAPKDLFDPAPTKN
jgi:pilus assembly protein CpaF